MVGVVLQILGEHIEVFEGIAQPHSPGDQYDEEMSEKSEVASIHCHVS